MRSLISFAKGFLSFFPKADILEKSRGTGGSDKANYCYGVWMKHLTLMYEGGVHQIPRAMAELGPGDSIGIGLAALLSGVDHYYGLDVVQYANKEKNQRILDDLIPLFKSRAPLLSKGWPDYSHLLDRNHFPGHILTDQSLQESLSDRRIELIRKAIDGKTTKNDEISIDYIVPWNNKSVINRGSVNLILSHAVMEYIKDLDSAYDSMYYWLADGGVISHQIDFRSHGLSGKWNGHWAYSERAWKWIAGKRVLIINRQPCSMHHNLIRQKGFRIISDYKSQLQDGFPKSSLSAPWRNMCEEDASCSGAFIQAVKPKKSRLRSEFRN